MEFTAHEYSPLVLFVELSNVVELIYSLVVAFISVLVQTMLSILFLPFNQVMLVGG